MFVHGNQTVGVAVEGKSHIRLITQYFARKIVRVHGAAVFIDRKTVVHAVRRNYACARAAENVRRNSVRRPERSVQHDGFARKAVFDGVQQKFAVAFD